MVDSANRSRWPRAPRPVRLFRPTSLPALIALGVVLVLGIFVDRQSQVLDEQQLRGDVLHKVSLIRAKLEGNINGNLQLVRGLVSTISTEPSMMQSRFAQLASSLMRERSQLRNIAGAPGLKVSLLYPVAGNEKALGLDYSKNEQQRAAALRARDTGELVLAGPVDLVQGGQGLIGRFPVFVDGPAGDRIFWGIISAVVDLDQLYRESGLTESNLDIAITGRDAMGAAGERFYGPESVLQSDPVTSDVVLPSGRWQIAAVPRGGWQTHVASATPRRLLIALAALLVAMPMLVTGVLYDERRRHIMELRRRERELARLSRRLELALDTSQVGVWEMDLATQDLFWDDRMNELYGLAADDGARDYTHWRDRLHPDDLERASEEFSVAVRTRGRYLSEYRVIPAPGVVRHIRAIGAVYADPETTPKILGVNWDVTADVTLNEELRRANRLTEARNAQLEAAKARIEHTSLHDFLTGLPNRRYLEDRLERLAGICAETGDTVALLHIDLDRFKQINDTLGHAAGDAMLVHAAQVMRANVRPEDVLSRIGGDEFVIVLTASDAAARAEAIAGRIIEAMRQPVDYGGHPCRFGVSIGIACETAGSVSRERLLINADLALYRAKSRGRSRFEFFSETLQAEILQSKRVADEILGGLEQHQFVPFYQPQFDARTLRLVGVEALARWIHPVEGILPPDRFLRVAEDLNVVAAIDRTVLEQSLVDLDRWNRLGFDVPRVSVNVSLRRLNDERLIEGLRDLEIPRGSLSFELVESIYLDDNDEVVTANLDELKKLGIGIEIDDFGTGYASIVSLMKLKPHRLKIDRQLVTPIVSSVAQRQLVTSIVEIGKTLGIEVVAEGVETMEHARMLRDLGCDVLQGFAFARALGAGDLEMFLSARERKAS